MKNIVRANVAPLMILLAASACSSSPDATDSGVRDASTSSDANTSQDGSTTSDSGTMNDGGMVEEFCMASTPQSYLHEGRCRNDDGTVDTTATDTCLIDRDYMEFF